MTYDQPIESSKMLPDIYVVRTVFMLETAPQSNEYHQVKFTAEQFKKILRFVQDQMGPCADKNHKHIEPCFEVPIEEKYTVKMPDMVSCYYDQV